MIAWIGGAYVFDLPLPYLTSLAASLLAYAAVAVMQRPPTSIIVPG
jgi:hypothetical protein